MRRNTLRIAGFTLPEVLATLVLLGLLLPIVLRGVTLSMHAAADARHRGEAAVLAESLLYEVAYTGAAVAPQGDFGPDWPGYTWRLNRTAAGDGMTEIGVEVAWVARGQTRSVAVATWVDPLRGGLLQ
jgi:prepilin-type N-terminal cleavage/methylation domain-containing protein